MSDFTMPSLGADMAAATMMTWKVKPGDAVKRGDVVAEVETDKGLIEIEIFEDGTVEELVAKIGEKLPVGALLARIRGAAGEPAKAPVPAAAAAPVMAAPAAAPPVNVAHPSERPHRVSPLARKVAAELGVDLATVEGSGPGGAIERADVERAAAARGAKPALPAEPPADSSPLRRAIAAAMAKSNREIPHYYLDSTIDMTRALAWLEQENARRPIKDRLLPAVLLLKAVAGALKEQPDLNGVWRDERLVLSERIHINFAIALRQGGLITPAIHDVDRKSHDEIMAALNDLIPRARAGHLRSSELAEGTITLTHLGESAVDRVWGVIYPPQVAIVGFGRIAEQPWAENGMLGVRRVVHATLAGDHRATDGRSGARFLEALNQQLQNP
jgi:pyruvate dehydrogenase E2 component (dihydrolipoamide acetyltransferase)